MRDLDASRLLTFQMSPHVYEIKIEKEKIKLV